MATRLRVNFTDGVINGSVDELVTSLSSTQFASLPVVGAGEHLAIVVDDEVMHVTDHAVSAETVTVTRGQEGTTAASHADGAAWEHAPTVRDFDESYRPLRAVSASGAATEIDVTAASVWDITLTADCALTFVGGITDEHWGFRMVLRQDATGGWVVTWPASVLWEGGEEPLLSQGGEVILSPGVSAVDILEFFTVDGGTTWFGLLVGQAMS